MNIHTRSNKGQDRKVILAAGLLLLEVSIIVISFFFLTSLNAFAEVAGNATMLTTLQVGNVYPEVINVTIEGGVGSVTLVANATKLVSAFIIARDFNGEADIRNLTAEFFDKVASAYGSGDDKNNHYTNLSCSLDTSYGDLYEISANCSFFVNYNANNATWNMTVMATDNSSFHGYNSNRISINSLMAVGIPTSLDYGIVNATAVSDEKIVNVTNYGNIVLNITLRGYAYNESDNLAMNCTLGSIKNISIGYEKYNLTFSNTSVLNITEFETKYSNLTNASVTRKFGLNFRQDESVNEATNETYWRIYVPTGVAGSCQGHIVIGAIRGLGT